MRPILLRLQAVWLLFWDFRRWNLRRAKDQIIIDHIRRQRLDEGDRD